QMLRIVGIDAYLARGGKLENDLFGDPEDARVLDVELLAEMVNEASLARQQAIIDAFHAYVDIGEDPVPDFSKDPNLPPYEIPYTMPLEGAITLAVDNAEGKRVRNVIARVDRKPGEGREHWDLKDEHGFFVPPGTYKYKAIAAPPIELRYQMTPYPNVNVHAPGNSAWQNGHSGSGGWLADHSATQAVCAVGDRVFLGAPCAESGVALIECDLEGRKQWGHHNFTAWTGPSFLASDEEYVYVGAPGSKHTVESIWRVHLETKETEVFREINSTHQRIRGMRGMAADDKHVYLSIRAPSSWLRNAASGEDVDIVNCLPKYPAKEEGSDRYAPDIRVDFMRMFRLTGTPPGQREGLTYLHSTSMPAPRQHILLAFKRKVPLGSLVFPWPDDKSLRISFSYLKDDAAYPPDAFKENQWTTFFKSRGKDRIRYWDVIPAPEGVETRALRISFDRGDAAMDELNAALDDMETEDTGLSLDGGGGMGPKQDPWEARLEGLKILRRRYETLLPGAQVRVNGGQVNTDGEWYARRDAPVSLSEPGIYVLQWDDPQEVRGLAIKEVDGKRTLIDVYEGTDSNIDIDAENGWRQVGVYRQNRRYYYQPDPNRNHEARYMDGYVDFGETVKTRAVRLRIVEQWTSRPEGRAGCYGMRADRGGMDLDPTRCRVFGVAPVRYLGGETPIDPMIYERIEVYDRNTRKLLSEVGVDRPDELALSPDGALHVASRDRVLRVDLESGDHAVVTDDPEWVKSLAFDKAGNLYVFDSGAERRNIRVYTPDGAFQRTIGTPGGYEVGPWDPTRFTVDARHEVQMDIDDRDQIWVVEKHNAGKRISRWSTAGEWQKDFFGNTAYGGDGCLDPWDKTRLFLGYGNATLEFALDWETGATRIKNLLWLGNSEGGEVPIRIEDRTYLVTRPMFGTHAAGIVYLYEGDRLRRVAAVGAGDGFPVLSTKAIRDKLGKLSLSDVRFIWTDRNGDGDPQVDEVDFEKRKFKGVHWFDHTLSIQAGRFRFECTGFLDNGAPTYEFREMRGMPDDPGRKLPTGEYVFFRGRNYKGEPANVAYSEAGDEVWSYRTEGYGVHALNRAKPYFPAQVVAEFDIIGSAEVHEGGLGTIFLTNTNFGTWHIWTSDGLLAGRAFQDLRVRGRKSWSMPEHERGLDLTNVNPGQEHFNGYFCKSHADNRYFLVAGHNHASVVEIVGLDKFQRLTGELTVAAEDIQAAKEWDRRQKARQAYEAAKILHCYPAPEPVVVDGSPEEWSNLTSGMAEGRIRL
ncbi:MAG: hypothetical protein ACOCX4_08060, partial [Planctomycetota bacterium]